MRAGGRATPAPAAAVTAVRRAVATALDDVPDGTLVLVACSGGADSLALASGLAFLADSRRPPGRGRRLRTGAVVVDHGWHPGSEAVATRAAQACRDLGLGAGGEVVVRALAEHRGVPGAGGPEAAARTARYGALDDEATRVDAAAVLLGHTLDDQAETVLLGLARGSGTRSLAGMPAARGRYRRPLLGLTRATTRACCDALGLQPWDDPANADTAYARVRVRDGLARWRDDLARALERTPAALDVALARTAEIAREDADALDVLAAQVEARARVPLDPSGDTLRVDLDVEVLAAALPAVRRRVLLRVVREVSADPEEVGRGHVLAVESLLSVGAAGGARVDLPGRVEAVRGRGPGYGRLTVRRAGTPQRRVPPAT